MLTLFALDCVLFGDLVISTIMSFLIGLFGALLIGVGVVNSIIILLYYEKKSVWKVFFIGAPIMLFTLIPTMISALVCFGAVGAFAGAGILIGITLGIQAIFAFINFKRIKASR